LDVNEKWRQKRWINRELNDSLLVTLKVSAKMEKCENAQETPNSRAHRSKPGNTP
jgi:hypothetical protein